MRGKKAKALCRAAEAATAGKPAVAYKEGPKGERYTTRIGPDGRAIRETHVITGTIALRSDCTRAVYQRMKRRAA